MHACMHACMYVCMYVCVYVCVCIYICIYTHTGIHVDAHECSVYSHALTPHMPTKIRAQVLVVDGVYEQFQEILALAATLKAAPSTV